VVEVKLQINLLHMYIASMYMYKAAIMKSPKLYSLKKDFIMTLYYQDVEICTDQTEQTLFVYQNSLF